MTIFAKEAEFENAVIHELRQRGWGDAEVIKNASEADLLANWKQILFENNRGVDRLNEVLLTEGELQQIMEQITALRTPLKLNGFINGKTVAITRDNPADTLHFGKEVSLMIYDRHEIAAGQSRYQIVQQPRYARGSQILNDRRGDLLLLINGMPVIHIELKGSGVAASQAYNQIQKYSREGIFTGLFSLIQIFVAMEPAEALYFANPGPDGKFNKDYAFHWVTLSQGSKFHAIFATSSIVEAITYYRLIKVQCPELKITALFDSNVDMVFERLGVARVQSAMTHQEYLTLVQRYKELAIGGGGGGGQDVPFEIDNHITEIDTGKINTDYMNSRFTKYRRVLQSGDPQAMETTLAELHRSFSSLSQEEQKFAEIFLHDIQRGDVQIDSDRTFRDYLTDYKTKAKNKEVEAIVKYLGVDAEKLLALMNSNISEANLNEYGRFDDLKETVDQQKANAYFEGLEGNALPLFRVNIKAATLLKRFILADGFELENVDSVLLDECKSKSEGPHTDDTSRTKDN